ncbi:MAG: hypothetical protein CME04_05445 [Gemmatimonadaceae bacterium]|nr:hypothetical protein [Gemmatimonadaceae bacterium]
MVGPGRIETKAATPVLVYYWPIMSTAIQSNQQTTACDARQRRATRAAAAFEAMVSCAVPEIPAQGFLAGPHTFDWDAARERLDHTLDRGDDNLHFALNVETLLGRGFSDIAEKATARTRDCQGEAAVFLEAIARCHRAAADFAGKHARIAADQADSSQGEEAQRLEQISTTCQAVASQAPASFRQAVQLFWFAWCLRGRGTIGRLDQHLYPFYKADLDTDRIDRQEALRILVELWEGFNRGDTGDTLRNLMLGGLDRQGHDATNDLTYLMIDAALTVCKPEPHLCARVHGSSPATFLDRVADLQLFGHGQGTIYHDDALIPSLIEKGVPPESARNYSNDGCTEVTIDGESGISFLQLEAVKALELTLFNGEQNVLHGNPVGRYVTRLQEPRALRTGLVTGYRSGDFTAMTDFAQLYEAFLDQYLYQVDRKLEELTRGVEHSMEHGCSSPFQAGTFPECLQTGRDPFRGGFTVPCHMLFSGSIPTVADGLAAVRQVVFEQQQCSPATMLDALRANFEGYESLRHLCRKAPKFGNDDERVDELAADIARHFCERVKGWPTPTGKPYWPALYNHLFNDFAKVIGATPDGRRWNDPIAEHYSPTPGQARSGPTAVIRSAARGPLADACGSAVFHISLSRTMVPRNDEGRQLLRGLIGGAMDQGVAVMNTAIYDVAALKEAQMNPEGHQDLIVRVWGFSARFVELSADIQDHVIQRTNQEA